MARSWSPCPSHSMCPLPSSSRCWPPDKRFAPVTSRRADDPRLRPGPASDDLRMDRPGQGIHMLRELLHLLRERRVLLQKLLLLAGEVVAVAGGGLLVNLDVGRLARLGERGQRSRVGG